MPCPSWAPRCHLCLLLVWTSVSGFLRGHREICVWGSGSDVSEEPTGLSHLLCSSSYPEAQVNFQEFLSRGALSNWSITQTGLLWRRKGSLDSEGQSNSCGHPGQIFMVPSAPGLPCLSDNQYLFLLRREDWTQNLLTKLNLRPCLALYFKTGSC